MPAGDRACHAAPHIPFPFARPALPAPPPLPGPPPLPALPSRLCTPGFGPIGVCIP
ncbi:hypothetical protein GR255_15535 [Mycobacterium tuberculosis]|nr:hypothetical protein [Mycobacterium tuberculosis]